MNTLSLNPIQLRQKSDIKTSSEFLPGLTLIMDANPSPTAYHEYPYASQLERLPLHRFGDEGTYNPHFDETNNPAHCIDKYLLSRLSKADELLRTVGRVQRIGDFSFLSCHGEPPRIVDFRQDDWAEQLLGEAKKHGCELIHFAQHTLSTPDNHHAKRWQSLHELSSERQLPVVVRMVDDGLRKALSDAGARIEMHKRDDVGESVYLAENYPDIYDGDDYPAFGFEEQYPPLRWSEKTGQVIKL